MFWFCKEEVQEEDAADTAEDDLASGGSSSLRFRDELEEVRWRWFCCRCCCESIEGLKKRKDDLLERVETELNLNENNILEFSNLNHVENLPDAVTQEEKLDEKIRRF